VHLKTPEVSHLGVADDITDLVGGTPMLRLKRLVPAGSADIFAKLEYLNPGGSVKDRAAIGIIRKAEQEGKLASGGTIVEATAGNTGIGLALIGVNRGYKVKLFVPENFSEEKVIIMRALGAEVERTPDDEGMQGAIRRAKELVATVRGAFMAGQFENQANPDYHYETTAVEMFEQMNGKVDAIVLGCGTCGTFTGVARYMKEHVPEVLAVAVTTQGSVLGGGAPGPHKVEGIGNNFIPDTFDPSVSDEVIAVSAWDRASWWRRLFRILRNGICRRRFLKAEFEQQIARSWSIDLDLPPQSQRFWSLRCGLLNTCKKLADHK
jgi:cysteine synthase A